MSDSDNSQERSEAPTEKRLRKSREEGQVARSKDLNTAVLLLVGVTGLVWFGQVFYTLFTDVMEATYRFDKAFLVDTQNMPKVLKEVMVDAIASTLPYFLLLFGIMIVAGSMPGGFNFSAKLLMPKGSRLNPLSGLKRMVGAQAWIELFKSMLKIMLLGGCLALFMFELSDRLLGLSNMPVKAAFFEGLTLLSLCLFLTVALLIIVAAIDVPYQQHSISNKTKMTKQEVKEERKSTDGSPEIKGRIRQIQYEMANRKLNERVPDADVIITNPTHYAVAIKYAKDKAGAPYLVAKGVDEMALRIRTLAKEHDLEIIELPPLARAVYYSTRVDQEIPVGLYTAIAYVLTYVTQLKAYRTGRGQKPAPIPALNIPKSLLDRANNRGN